MSFSMSASGISQTTPIHSWFAACCMQFCMYITGWLSYEKILKGTSGHTDLKDAR